MLNKNCEIFKEIDDMYQLCFTIFDKHMLGSANTTEGFGAELTAIFRYLNLTGYLLIYIK